MVRNNCDNIGVNLAKFSCTQITDGLQTIVIPSGVQI